MIKIINFILLTIFVIVVLIFALSNGPQLVRVKFWTYESIKMQLPVVVFASIILGIVIALMYHFYILFKIKKENKEKEDVIRNKNLGKN
jgi:uncharacterized integral membrane protein